MAWRFRRWNRSRITIYTICVLLAVAQCYYLFRSTNKSSTKIQLPVDIIELHVENDHTKPSIQPDEQLNKTLYLLKIVQEDEANEWSYTRDLPFPLQQESKVITNQESKIIRNQETKDIAKQESKVITNQESKVITNQEPKINHESKNNNQQSRDIKSLSILAISAKRAPVVDIAHTLGSLGVNLTILDLQTAVTSEPHGLKFPRHIFDLEEKDFAVFYRENQNNSLLKSVDAFLCVFPIALCQLFQLFEKPFILYIEDRYQAGSHRFHEWKFLNDFLTLASQNPKSSLLASNAYDVEYVRYFTGLEPMLVPYSCDYLAQSLLYKQSQERRKRQERQDTQERQERLETQESQEKQHRQETPERQEKQEVQEKQQKHYLVWATTGNEHLSQFLANIRRHLDLQINAQDVQLSSLKHELSPEQLTEYSGVIVLPHQVSFLALTELYRRNIPLFVPSLDLLTTFHIHKRILTHKRCRLCALQSPHLRLATQKSLLEGVMTLPDPNNDSKSSAVGYWLMYSDPYTLRHLVNFLTPADLAEKLGVMTTSALRGISAKMAAENAKIRASVRSTWSDVLMRVRSADDVVIR